jgi:hypothetical protein
MLKVSSAYRKKDVLKEQMKYRLYVKRKNDKKLFHMGSFDTIEEARECHKKGFNNSGLWKLDQKYVIKKVKQIFEEETVEIDPMSRLVKKLPEFEGIL